jgi:DNA-directed RNA polymerase I, II, and III subunit RPABC2
MSYFDSDNEKDKYESEEDEKESDEDDILDDDDSVEDLFNLDENIQTIENKEKKKTLDEDLGDEIIGTEDFDVSDGEDENYLQKFNRQVNKDYIAENHPECIVYNNHEIEALSCITRDGAGHIVDMNHSTLPILTKYEKTRVLGQRASQINNGAPPYIQIPEGVIDGYIIAKLELAEKKIPFIIQRPLPNGSKEFWKLEDLEQIDF